MKQLLLLSFIFLVACSKNDKQPIKTNVVITLKPWQEPALTEIKINGTIYKVYDKEEKIEYVATENDTIEMSSDDPKAQIRVSVWVGDSHIVDDILDVRKPYTYNKRLDKSYLEYIGAKKVRLTHIP